MPDPFDIPESTAVFTEAYAVIPACTQRDIVSSILPGWSKMHMWVLARPLSGFAETFSQYAVYLAPSGGSDQPEEDETAQSVLFMADGSSCLTVEGQDHALVPGSYAYIAPAAKWRIWNTTDMPCRFHWIRKRYSPVAGLAPPVSFVTSDKAVDALPMPGGDGRWLTTRFVDLADLAHDMHVNIVTFRPGGRIPFAETHVMEHGIYVLQGNAKYLLNTDWISVAPGDFLWLRAFCPQACIATGPELFRYLLYKDVNRHAPL
ncbi:MAG: bifunctional allantoicase/(S)-ureidoglycine aminohydrolase [Pseudomonadota bacterium]